MTLVSVDIPLEVVDQLIEVGEMSETELISQYVEMVLRKIITGELIERERE